MDVLIKSLTQRFGNTPVWMSRKLFHSPKHVSFNIKADRMHASQIEYLLLPYKVVSEAKYTLEIWFEIKETPTWVEL